MTTTSGKTRGDLVEAMRTLAAETGILGGVNVLCCQTCARAEMERRTATAPRPMRGYAFWHVQDEDELRATGSLRIGFDSTLADPPDDATRDIGLAVAAHLQARGFAVEWDGSPATRLRITGVAEVRQPELHIPHPSRRTAR